MTVHVITRAQLQLGQPVPARLQLRTPAEVHELHRGVTWHHVGDGGTLYRPNQVDRLRGIWRYHVESRGYGDIAYHGAFDADGVVYELRDGRYVGAHATSTNNVANRLTDGVCFLEDRRGVTQAALEAMRWWVDLELYLHAGVCEQWAHEAWAHTQGGTPTACPGADLVNVVRAHHGHV